MNGSQGQRQPDGVAPKGLKTIPVWRRQQFASQCSHGLDGGFGHESSQLPIRISFYNFSVRIFLRPSKRPRGNTCYSASAVRTNTVSNPGRFRAFISGGSHDPRSSAVFPPHGCNQSESFTRGSFTSARPQRRRERVSRGKRQAHGISDSAELVYGSSQGINDVRGARGSHSYLDLRGGQAASTDSWLQDERILRSQRRGGNHECGQGFPDD